MIFRDYHDAPPRYCRRRGKVAAIIMAFGLVSSLGCTREFFREWADQDVTENIFEKSRDPRWRLEIFSKEPPKLARFAQPYDPDRPPAPPDDYAAERLSPTPQWPHHRLMVPAEGTGYIDMLEAWRQREGYVEQNVGPAPTPVNVIEPTETKPVDNPNPPTDVDPRLHPPVDTEIPPPPSVNPGAASRAKKPAGAKISANSGPNRAKKTPISLASSPARSNPGPISSTLTSTRPGALRPKNESQPKALEVTKAAARDGKISPTRTVARTDRTGAPKDPALRRASRETSADRAEQVPPAPRPATDHPQVSPPERSVRDPAIGGDPNAPNTNLAEPPVKPIVPGRLDDAAREETARLLEKLVPRVETYPAAEAAGLPRGSRPYILGPEQALTLALINSRPYQYQLEQVYLASLAVTLQRFNFEPQFYAGLNPLTGPALAGIPAPNYIDQFTYRTKQAPGGGISNLNLGTAAGVGKQFANGIRLLAGFANQTVFNFSGRNGVQPSVASVIPINIVIPFLRGGGRAVTMEQLTLAERNLLYQIRAYARFRQEFVPSILSQNQALTNPGTGDPTVGYLTVLALYQQVANDRRNVIAFEAYRRIFKEFVPGDTGIGQQQIDQIELQLINFRFQLAQDIVNYRNILDSYKIQLGLPPDLPVVLDLGLIQGFSDVFDEVDLWARKGRRELEELDGIVAKLPELYPVYIDGHNILDIALPKSGAENTAELNAALLAAERVALENRLDLMNSRAQLYDAWRALAVTANALKGFLNVDLTNQVLTPPTTTNPFGFLSNSKQFSLILNAELPLVRVAERNNYITSIINYERNRRSLMISEDQIKFTIRQSIRNLQFTAQNYELTKRRYVFSIRIKDETIDQILAPPAADAAAGAGGGGSNGATQTINLTTAQANLLTFQNLLTTTWVAYQSLRLSLYRDLGTMPIDEWETYHELFPSKSGLTGGNSSARAEPRTAPAGTRSATVAPTRRRGAA